MTSKEKQTGVVTVDVIDPQNDSQGLMPAALALQKTVYPNEDRFNASYTHILVRVDGVPAATMRAKIVDADRMSDTYSGNQFRFRFPVGTNRVIDFGRLAVAEEFRGGGMGVIFHVFSPVLKAMVEGKADVAVGCVSMWGGCDPSLHESVLAMQREWMLPIEESPQALPTDAGSYVDVSGGAVSSPEEDRITLRSRQEARLMRLYRTFDARPGRKARRDPAINTLMLPFLWLIKQADKRKRAQRIADLSPVSI